MHVTHADLCAIYERLAPAERALVLAEAHAKGIEVHEVLLRGVESLIDAKDRPTRGLLKIWHQRAERPSVVVSSAERLRPC